MWPNLAVLGALWSKIPAKSQGGHSAWHPDPAWGTEVHKVEPPGKLIRRAE